MALNLRTTTQVESHETEDQLRALLNGYTGNIKSVATQIRAAAVRCVTARRAARYVALMQSEDILTPDAYLQGIVDKLRADNPKYSLHDLHVGLEGVVEDYSKKVSTFAQTLITTVKNYSVTVFDLFVKKLRMNKDIDTSKFTELDSSMRMVVMTYGDYAELANPIVNNIGVVVKDVQSILPILTKLRNQLKDKEDTKDALEQLNKMVREGAVAKFLNEHKLVEFTYGADTNGTEGLIGVGPSKRLVKIEESNVLSEVGWNDVDKVKNAVVFKHAESVSKYINQLYKLSVDIMDEGRRISTDFCVKDPYVCTAIVKFGSILSQEINLYTKAFDLCWTTALRVSQACLIG